MKKWLRGKKKKKKRLYLGKASRIRKKSFQKILLVDSDIRRRIYTTPVLGRWGVVWGSVVTSGNLSKNISKKAIKLFLVRGVPACVSLWAAVVTNSKLLLGKVWIPALSMGLLPGVEGIAALEEAEREQVGHKITCTCISQLSHTQFCQARKEFSISSPGVCESKHGIPSFVSMENRPWGGPCWGGTISTILVCDIFYARLQWKE